MLSSRRKPGCRIAVLRPHSRHDRANEAGAIDGSKAKTPLILSGEGSFVRA
jgi:hypothetical protein